jgi:hypothetical protein
MIRHAWGYLDVLGVPAARIKSRTRLTVSKCGSRMLDQRRENRMPERGSSRGEESGQQARRSAARRRPHGRGREEEGGDDPARHARIQARRWLGSPPPTAERYARALRQWRALPGAVVSPGTGMGPGSDLPVGGTKSEAGEEDMA